MFKKIKFLVLFSLMIPTIARAEMFEANIENKQIPYGELFYLNLAYEGDNGQSIQPDLSPLNENFNVYSTSTSVQTNIINGVTNQRRDWDIGLLPKKEGKLIIPAIVAGKFSSKPIEINVQPAGSINHNVTDNNLQNDNVLAKTEAKFAINLEVDDKTPYVQQEVNARLTINDYAGLQLTSEPIFENADNWVIKPLGQPKVKKIANGGREISFEYALFPQKSGQLDVPAVNVQGYYVDMAKNKPNKQPRQIGFFQMMDMDIDDMFGVKKPVSLFSRPISLEVKPVAENYGNAWWLPASDFVMKAKWSDEKPTFKVGETVAREIVLIASGVSDTQMPEIQFSEDENMKIYPDKPQISASVTGGEIVAKSVFRIVYIPQKAGENVIPQIEVPWFNVLKKQKEILIIPAEKIMVQKNLQVAEPETLVPNKQKIEQNNQNNLQKTEDVVKTKKINKSNNFADITKGKISDKMLFILLGLAFFFGFLVSFALFHKPSDKHEFVMDSGLLKKIKRDVERKDYKKLRDDLVKWGTENFAATNINNLNDLAAEIANPNFEEQMQIINRILYAGGNEIVDGEVIVQCLKNCQKNKITNTKLPLPDLYK